MIPAGYLLKRTVPPPGWLGPDAPHVTEVCSVSNCVNDNAVEPQDSWLHNGFGVANDPDVLWKLAREGDVDLSGSKLFYYCADMRELYSDGRTFDKLKWQPISRAPSSSLPDQVVIPSADAGLVMLGYDVVVFGDYLEHSPLSCQSVATELGVNNYCLLNSLEEARWAIDSGKFKDCKEGIYKIFSVSLVSTAQS
jgi:hypothetical protein